MQNNAGPIAHFAQMRRELLVERPLQGKRNFGDVGRLVANAFQIARDFKRRRHAMQISRNGLLGEQQLHAQPLDLAFLVVDVVVAIDHRIRCFGIAGGKRRDARAQGVFRRRRHNQQLGIEQLQLRIQYCACHA